MGVRVVPIMSNIQNRGRAFFVSLSAVYATFGIIAAIATVV
jgi:hypothetical protein